MGSPRLRRRRHALRPGSPWTLACGLLVLLCLALHSRRSDAAGNQTIVLLRVQGDAHVARRLRAELMALGWVVREVTPEPPASERSAAMGDVVKNLGALAVMRANPEAAQVELWVVHPPSSSIDPAILHDSVGAPADDVLAVLAVEALRAKLLRLGVVSADTAPPPAPAEPPPEPREHLFWLSAAPALLLSPGGMGVTPQALLGVNVMLSQRWSTGLWASLPLTRAMLDAAGVERWNDAWVDASIAQYGARASYRALRSGPWDASIGLGATLTVIALEAHAQTPWWGTEETLFAAGPVLAADLSYEIVAGLRVGGQLMLGSVFPRPVLEFDQTSVASWGRPFVSAGLGLSLGLPGVYR
ncbi:MAG: hypothetical protein ABW217_03795 [Polyangiaceae bacterium]